MAKEVWKLAEKSADRMRESKKRWQKQAEAESNPHVRATCLKIVAEYEEEAAKMDRLAIEWGKPASPKS